MMPSPVSTNYFFLLKCLAGISIFSILLAYLFKPTYIVVAATTALAATTTTSLFFPLLPILAAGLFITALMALPVIFASYSDMAIWNPFLPAFYFDSTHPNYSWFNWGGSNYHEHHHPSTHRHSIFSNDSHSHHHGFNASDSHTPTHVESHRHPH